MACPITTSRRASARAYDLFGNGKTALKVNLGKYLAAADGSSITGALTQSADARLDSPRSPELDRRQQQLPARLRPDEHAGAGPSPVGWRLRAALGCNAELWPAGSVQHHLRPGDSQRLGKRAYDWNFGVQVQQQLLPRVSVEVGYFRRSFGNFFVTDNRAFARDAITTRSASSRRADPGSRTAAATRFRSCITSHHSSSDSSDNNLPRAFSDTYGTRTAALERRRGQFQRADPRTG